MAAITPSSSSAVDPARVTPGGRPASVGGRSTARRRAARSPWRRAALIVFPAGALLSLGAAFGPVWVVRVGVLAALLTAATLWWLSRAELAEARDDHARRSDRAAADHRSAADRSARLLRREAEGHERLAAEQSERVAALEQRVGVLQAELLGASGRNHDLAIRLQLSQDELSRLQGAPVDPSGRTEEDVADVADIRSLPRRVLRTPAQPDPGWDNLEVDVS